MKWGCFVRKAVFYFRVFKFSEMIVVGDVLEAMFTLDRWLRCVRVFNCSFVLEVFCFFGFECFESGEDISWGFFLVLEGEDRRF